MSARKSHQSSKACAAPPGVGESGETVRQALFENLARAADVLAQTFGHTCEVVLHDFRDTGHSLVHIAGQLTGRSPGVPLTNTAVLRDWRDKGDAVEDLINYQTSAGNSRLMKSSTCYVRDDRGTVIGALGINFDCTELKAVERLVKELTRMESPDAPARDAAVPPLMQNSDLVLEYALRQFGKSPLTMNRSEKIAFIRHLESEGVFLVKGMVNSVATSLNISIYTVYNHLRRIKQTGALDEASGETSLSEQHVADDQSASACPCKGETKHE